MIECTSSPEEQVTILTEAQTGVTLIIDGRPLDVDLSFRNAVEWRVIVWASFPNTDIMIDWRKFYL